MAASCAWDDCSLKGLTRGAIHASAEAGGFLVQRKAAAARKRRAATQQEDTDSPAPVAEADAGIAEAAAPPVQQLHPSAEQEGPGAVQVADEPDMGDTASQAGVQTTFGLGGGQRKDPLEDGDDEEVKLEAG